MSLVSLAPCGSYDEQEVRQALEEALSPLGGLDWVAPGMKIALKPNLVSRAAPEDAVTTHPVVIRVLTKMLLEKGASVLIGDSPGGLFLPQTLQVLYAGTGMTEAEALGAHLNKDVSVKTASFPEALCAKSFQYTAYLDEADAIINVCKLKTHGMMGMSAAVKNLFGTVPGTVKLEYHYRFSQRTDFVRMLLDLSAFFKPRLHICDAVLAMEGNGPTNGTPRPVGALLASSCPHSLDLALAHIMGLSPRDVPTLSEAVSLGLIPERIEDLPVSGDLSAYAKGKFETVPVRRSLRFENSLPRPLQPAASYILRHGISPRPAVEKASCVGCGKCAALCPAKAIQMEKKRPVIRLNQCIRCFCCQEFCPVGALRPVRPWLARLLSR